MASVLENGATEEQRSFVRFLSAKEHNAKDIHKEMCRVYARKCLSCKAVQNWGGKRFADDEEFETEVRKRLRQQSKDFHAAGFHALVKR
jgi:hypothetical protein